MWTLLEMLLDVLVAVADVIFWRFTACLFLSLALAAAILWLMPENPVRYVLAGLVVVVGITIGTVWQRRA